MFYESTGAYSTILEQFCQEKEILCFKVGAYQSASFSKVIKNRSKTDKLDARMLSKMYILAKKEDIKVPKRDEEAHQIRSYIKYYQSLVKEHRRQSNYLEASTYNLEDKFILKQVKKKITAIEKEKAMIIEKVLEIIKANPTYSQVRAILFMPTLNTIVYNPEMKLIYDRLVERGKPKMLTQMAVMRKVILLAHSLYKNNQKYDENRYLQFTQIKEVDMME